MAMTVAAAAGAQTLKMEHQVAGITTYETSTAVNLVVVKPEIRIDDLDPSVLTVNTNGVERNVLTVYPSDSILRVNILHSVLRSLRSRESVCQRQEAYGKKNMTSRWG